MRLPNLNPGDAPVYDTINVDSLLSGLQHREANQGLGRNPGNVPRGGSGS